MSNYTLNFPKITDQNLLAQYYSMADVFAICSKHEKFPTTCIEAQCCGTPVVGFDTMGTKETSMYSENDFVSHGDVESFKNKSEGILTRDTSDVASKAYEAYSKDNMAKRYLEEYDIDGKKQRILLIDVACKFSSTGKIVYDLFHYLKKEGREAAICYGRGELIKEDGIFKFGLDWETRIHAGLARLTGYNGCFSPFSTKRLIRYIENFKPDVIHIHELHAYFVNIKPLINYIKKRNIKVVSTFHCEYMYTGKCGYAYTCDKYRRICGKCPAVHEYPKSLFFDKTKQMFLMKKRLFEDLDMRIVTPSQWLADRVKTSFLKDKPIRVIHNGIDTDIFHPVDTSKLREELGLSPKNKVVISVAPNIMEPRKGGQWILKLAEMEKNPDTRFILVGNSSEKIEKYKNIIDIGVIKNQTVLANYYSLANVFVLCSEKETFSMTCAEALCCGTPVVGFKCGAPETVFTEPYAKFVEYGDIEQLREILSAMLN